MSNLLNLIKGEIIRLYKYKILIIGTIVSLIWVVIIALSDAITAKQLVPLLIFMDAAMMSIILHASSFYLEKQEGTIKTLLVTPVRLSDIIIAKAVAALFMGLISAVVVVTSGLVFHQIEINLLLLFIYIILIVSSHTAIGFAITLYSKDFGAMIVNYALFALVALVPSLLFAINIIPAEFSNFMLVSPSHAGQMLLNSTLGEVDLHVIIISIIYLISLTAILYRFIIYKKFKKYAIEG
jgi:fluoroquinolone transport system permease protein